MGTEPATPSAMTGVLHTVSWLDRLEEIMDVDVDSMDPRTAKSLSFQPHNQTSNQILVYEQMVIPENKELLLQAVEEYKNEGWSAVLDRISVLLCAKNIENFQGRVMVQTSPFHAYDTEKLVQQARNLAREFANVGIPKGRFCINIPATGPGLNAGPILLKDDIRIVGSPLSSLSQAIAASQAGCRYISIDYNMSADTESELRSDLVDPALDHPMSARILQMLETYKRLYQDTREDQPMITIANFNSLREVMASGEMGCHHATISPQMLSQLGVLPYDGTKQPGEGVPKAHPHPYENAASSTPARLARLLIVDPLATADWDSKLVNVAIDYLVDNGAELEKSIEADLFTKTRLLETLELLKSAELRCKEAIEKAITVG